MANNNNMSILDFEKPLLELDQKIKELQSFMDAKDLDLSEEIERLKKRARNLEEEIYDDLTTGQILKIARHPDRPTARDYINYTFDEFVELHGDRCYGDDKALIGGIGLISGKPFTFIGHQKGKTTKENLERNFGMAHPEGYRKALRLMKQAEKFNRPVLSFINTSGAYPGIGAEERGQAEAIARNLMEMSELRVPIIVIVTGEGGSGGALGIGMGDKIMMLEYSYYSVSSPEACAAILWKDSTKSEAAAEALKITSSELYELGLVDIVLSEPRGGAHKDPRKTAEIIKKALLNSYNELKSLSIEELLNRRYHKFRQMGEFNVGKDLLAIDGNNDEEVKEEVE